jgi:hypothetical protein
MSAKEAGTPTPTPIATSNNTSRMTIQITFLGSAPSAIRMPISRLLRATVPAFGAKCVLGNPIHESGWRGLWGPPETAGRIVGYLSNGYCGRGGLDSGLGVFRLAGQALP